MHPPDARGIARVAQNPACQVLAAQVLVNLPDKEFFAQYTGFTYDGSRGERTSALRWGTRFEAALTERGAARLRQAIDGQLGISAARATVLDLRKAVPSRRADAWSERHRLTRGILADSLTGHTVPDVILQPPLVLRAGGTAGYIVPDALVYDLGSGGYVPLEAKAYLSINGVLPANQRAGLRLQAAVQAHALYAEYARLNERWLVRPWALFVFATPFGFRPTPAVLEELEAEVVAVDTALRTLDETASALEGLTQWWRHREALRQLRPHYQESCLSSCVLAQHCRRSAPGVRGAIGDRAASQIGMAIDLDRAAALVAGEPPVTAAESALLASLTEAASIFPWQAS